MKLHTNPASPFARKVRVVAHVLGIALEEIATAPYQDENFRRINPLGKIPALRLDDGSVLFDSPVICEYLDALGGGCFFPAKGDSGRWHALKLQALGDGIADAAVAFVVEGRQENPHEAIRARNMAAIRAGLDALERTEFSQTPAIGEIAAACALGYLDLRIPDLGWRETRPKLAAWLARFEEWPAMRATAPKAP
jgi:glutathione S-transferase